MSVCDCSTKRGLNFHWSFNNTKLRKDNTVSFSIPAFRDKYGNITCPQAGECVLECYARGNHFMLPVVQNTLQHNFDFLLYDKGNNFINFSKYMRVDLYHLMNRGYTNIRVHSAGDFFRHKYFLAWLRLAKHFPSLSFYAYTKMIVFVNRARSFIPDNFKITCSFGGQSDSLINMNFPHSVVFNSKEDIKRFGYIDASEIDTSAREGKVKIGLHRHGNLVSRKKRASWKSTQRLLERENNGN